MSLRSLTVTFYIFLLPIVIFTVCVFFNFACVCVRVCTSSAKLSAVKSNFTLSQ